LDSLLNLLQLADSALPVGGSAHSLGLETLVEEGCLTVETIEEFFRGYLSEAGILEASFVRRTWRGDEDPLALTHEFVARRPARESRDAALRMGQRFGRLVNSFTGESLIPEGLAYPVAFGLAGARLDLDEDVVVLACLRQSIAALISACQRLMPIGQVAAGCLMWNLNPFISSAARGSENTKEVGCFTPLAELASMRHASLETRLFIS
jgi:urease accessory protein